MIWLRLTIGRSISVRSTSKCEYDKFYDLDDEWLKPPLFRLFSKKREPCECKREPVRHD